MTSIISGLTLFLTSTAISMTISTIISKSVKSMIEKNYILTLQKLFKPVQYPAKPSRHQSLSNDEIFSIRKTFFNSIYNNTPLSTCKIIHVAGTKGKGSTIEHLSSCLIKNHKKVGIFTSPHIHTARERIKINRDLITQSNLTKYATIALELLKDMDWVVFFDYLLATSLLYFRDEDIQYMILESGIGGRYDSTNFIDNPHVCVITSISLDHQRILGDTIEQIAHQKAGIIKPRSHVFTPSTQVPSVMEVFRKECQQQNAILHEVPINSENLSKYDHVMDTNNVQIENLCLSIAVLEHMQVKPTGFESFYWPCRMEIFQYKNHAIILDGCHNGNSVYKFLTDLRRMYKDEKIIVLFGAGHDKCIDDMLYELFSPLHDINSIIMVQSKHFGSLSEYELLSKLSLDQINKINTKQQLEYNNNSNNNNNNNNNNYDNRLSLNRCDNGTVSKRLDSILKDSKSSVIAVCGSLFAAAEAREYLFSLDPSLFSSNDWVRKSDPLV